MPGAVSDDASAFGGDLFFAVPRERVRLSVADVLMPALCRQVTARAPMWLVDADRVAAKLSGSGLTPQRIAGRALVVLSFFHYGHATVGPYSEIGILVVARSEQRIGRGGAARIRRVARGLAAIELALDNELALAGGVELLGLRKYRSTLFHDIRGDRFRFGLESATGTHPLTVAGRIGAGVVAPTRRLVNLSTSHGDVIQAGVDLDSSWRVGTARDVRVTCDARDGGLGTHVADLGLADRRPFCVLAADDLRGRLNLATRVRDGQIVGPVVAQSEPTTPAAQVRE